MRKLNFIKIILVVTLTLNSYGPTLVMAAEPTVANATHAHPAITLSQVFTGTNEARLNQEKLEKGRADIKEILTNKSQFSEASFANDSKKLRLYSQVHSLIAAHPEVELPNQGKTIDQINKVIQEQSQRLLQFVDAIYSSASSEIKTNGPIAAEKTIAEIKTTATAPTSTTARSSKHTSIWKKKWWKPGGAQQSQANPFTSAKPEANLDTKNPARFSLQNTGHHATEIGKQGLLFLSAASVAAWYNLLRDYPSQPLKYKEVQDMILSPGFWITMVAFHSAGIATDSVLEKNKTVNKLIHGKKLRGTSHLTLSEIKNLQQSANSPDFEKRVQNSVAMRSTLLKIGFIAGGIFLIGAAPNTWENLSSCFPSKDDPKLQEKMQKCDYAWQDWLTNSASLAVGLSTLFPMMGLYFGALGLVQLSQAALALPQMAWLANVKNWRLVTRTVQIGNKLRIVGTIMVVGRLALSTTILSVALIALEGVMHYFRSPIAKHFYAKSLLGLEEDISEVASRYARADEVETQEKTKKENEKPSPAYVSPYGGYNFSERNSGTPLAIAADLTPLLRDYTNTNVGYLKELTAASEKKARDWNLHVYWVDTLHKIVQKMQSRILYQFQLKRAEDPLKAHFAGPTDEIDYNSLRKEDLPIFRTNPINGVRGINYNDLDLAIDEERQTYHEKMAPKIEAIDKGIEQIRNDMKAYYDFHKASPHQTGAKSQQYRALAKIYEHFVSFKKEKDYNKLAKGLKLFTSTWSEYSDVCNPESSQDKCILFNLGTIIFEPEVYHPGQVYFKALKNNHDKDGFKLNNPEIPKAWAAKTGQKHAIEYVVYQSICGEKWTTDFEFIDRSKGTESKFFIPRIVNDKAHKVFCAPQFVHGKGEGAFYRPFKLYLDGKYKHYKSIIHFLYEEVREDLVVADLESLYVRAEEQYTEYWETSQKFYDEHVVKKSLDLALYNNDEDASYPTAVVHVLKRTQRFFNSVISKINTHILRNDVTTQLAINQFLEGTQVEYEAVPADKMDPEAPMIVGSANLTYLKALYHGSNHCQRPVCDNSVMEEQTNQLMEDHNIKEIFNHLGSVNAMIQQYQNIKKLQEASVLSR